MAGSEPDEHFVLPGVLDLTAAPILAAALLERRGRGLRLDGAAVTRFGGPCLQVLLAAQATWRRDGTTFEVAPISEPMKSALTLLGAGDMITSKGD